MTILPKISAKSAMSQFFTVSFFSECLLVFRQLSHDTHAETAGGGLSVSLASICTKKGFDERNTKEGSELSTAVLHKKLLQ